VIAVVVLGALAVRLAFFSYRSGDFDAYFLQWYNFIVNNGGLHALRFQFANYNEPYLYLLTLLTYLKIPALAGVKLISVVFDFVLGWYAYRIVNLRYPATWWPILAGGLVLFLPTVVLNSSMWGQADAIYSAFAVGGLYYLLRNKPWLACVFFGLAFAFKLQIVFLLPLVLLLVLRKRVPWRALLLIPAVYLVLDIPAVLLGANIKDLLTVYVTETNTYDQLTLNAPNVYQYLGDVTGTGTIRTIGVVLTGVLVLVLIGLVVWKRVEMTATRIVLAGTVSVLLVPFLLPAMHERYFYLADALTVLAAFHLPRRLWALPILEQFASLFSYLPFLLMTGGGGRGFGGGARPGGGTRPAGGFPAGGFPGGARGGVPGAGATGQLPTPGTGQLPGAGGGGFGGNMRASIDTVVNFKILATAMLAALVLALWVAFVEFRRPDPSPQLEGPADDTPEESLVEPDEAATGVLHPGS
jgi:Gpi18-like mannosyltransferase